MGNAFMNLRKMEVSKVAPNRAALIGKFNQSMNSGNMSAMKEVEKADKKWLCILFGIPYEAEFQGEGTGSAAHVYNECGEEVLTYTEGVGWQEKETKAESQVHSALKSEKPDLILVHYKKSLGMFRLIGKISGIPVVGVEC